MKDKSKAKGAPIKVAPAKGGKAPAKGLGSGLPDKKDAQRIADVKTGFEMGVKVTMARMGQQQPGMGAGMGPRMMPPRPMAPRPPMAGRPGDPRQAAMAMLMGARGRR
jgi:hypothetical protein